MSRLTDMGVLSVMDPLGDPIARAQSDLERYLRTYNPKGLWVFEEFQTQLSAWEWINGNYGYYHDVIVRGNRDFLNTFVNAYYIYPYNNDAYIHVPNRASFFQEAAQSYVIYISPTTQGKILDRNGLFTLQISSGGNIQFQVTGHSQLTYSNDIFDGEWHTVVITMTSSIYNLYVDGALRDSGAIGTLPTPTTDLYVMRGQFDATTTFRGSVGPLMFLDYELSATAAAALDAFLDSELYGIEVAADNPMIWIRLRESLGHTAEPSTIDTYVGSVTMTKTGDLNIGYQRLNCIPGDPDLCMVRTYNGEYNSTAAAANSPSGSMSYELWCTGVTSYTSNLAFAYRGSGAPDIRWEAATERGIQIRIDNLTYKFVEADGFAPGRMHHIVMVHDESGAPTIENKIYVNGDLKASNATGTASYTINDSKVSMGPNTGSSEERFIEAEYAVYDTALSQTRVQAHYNAVLDSMIPHPWLAYGRELELYIDDTTGTNLWYRLGFSKTSYSNNGIFCRTADRQHQVDSPKYRTFVDIPWDANYGQGIDYEQDMSSGNYTGEFIPTTNFTLETIVTVTGKRATVDKCIWKMCDQSDGSTQRNINSGGARFDLLSTGHSTSPDTLEMSTRHYSEATTYSVGTVAFTIGDTYHLAISYNGTTGVATGYVNGEIVGTYDYLTNHSLSGALKASDACIWFNTANNPSVPVIVSDIVYHDHVVTQTQLRKHARAAGLYP